MGVGRVRDGVVLVGVEWREPGREGREVSGEGGGESMTGVSAHPEGGRSKRIRTEPPVSRDTRPRGPTPPQYQPNIKRHKSQETNRIESLEGDPSPHPDEKTRERLPSQ